jgi:hypothetical protein
MKPRLLFLSVLSLGYMLWTGCAKNKLNNTLPTQAVLTSSNSSIILYNFYGLPVDVTVNNLPLTSYAGNSSQTQGIQANQLGVALFPNGYWADGAAFAIPATLLDKQGNAHIRITPRGSFNTSAAGGYQAATVDTILQNTPLTPKDYYVQYTGRLAVIPHNAAAPSQPQNFKIRVINLAPVPDTFGFMGPVTVTYANGAPVDPALSNVPADTLPGYISSYIELPLGAYEFKLFWNGDPARQLVELPLIPNFNGSGTGQPPQEAILPLVRAFKAGATYSIVITPNTQFVPTYPISSMAPPTAIRTNSYRIVTEQAPAANTTYACMDAVSALDLPGISITVDGQPLGSNLAFGGYATHKVYVWGNHQVQVLDQDQQVIAAKSINMYANDYLTAWAYLDPGGKPDIVFSSTDMSGALYLTSPNGSAVNNTGSTYVPVTDDGTNGSIRIQNSTYLWQSRFLNLSEDVPFITFGSDLVTTPGNNEQDVLFTNLYPFGGGDSNNFATATINLGQGVTNAYDPFLQFQVISTSFFQNADGSTSAPVGGFFPRGANNIRVYQSEPGPPALVPGTVLGGVGPLPFHSFIANPAMYTSPSLAPQAEPGFYTVALIGRAFGNDASPEDQGRLIYVKHNQ